MRCCSGVKAGCHNDIQFSCRRDAGDPRDVAAQSDHSEIHDGVDTARLEFVEPGDGVGHPLLRIAPSFRKIPSDLGGHDEDVLVYERDAEVRGTDLAASGIQFWHNSMLVRSGGRPTVTTL